MACNMVLLHGLRENKSGGFYWLIQPLKRKHDYHDIYEPSPIMDKLTPTVRSQLKLCDHKFSCDTFVMEVRVSLSSKSVVTYFDVFSGHAEVFAIRSWPRNFPKFNLQLQFDTQATIKYSVYIFQTIELEFNCIFAQLCGHLSSKCCSQFRRSLLRMNIFFFYFLLQLSLLTVWQIDTISIKITSNRQKATVSPHLSVVLHSICIQLQPFSLTLLSRRLKSTGNCILIVSQLHSNWFHFKRLQYHESSIRFCLVICYIFEPSHHGWHHRC